jgi:signal transduction histidine kinase
MKMIGAEESLTGAHLGKQPNDKQLMYVELLNSILDASLDGIFACEAIRDERGNIIDLAFLKANKMFEQLIGKKEEDLLHTTYLTVFPSAQELFRLNASVIETKQAVRKEVYYKGDGIDAWFDISMTPLGDNGLVVSFNDISESKFGKEKIESSLHYLQTVINSSQTGITVIAPIYENGEIVDFRYKLVNETFSKVIEQEPQALRGEPLSKMFPLYKAQGTFERYKQIFLTGESQRFDLHYVKGGYDVWADIMAKKQGDEILVTFHDYTTLKLAQLKLEAMVKDLQRSNANLEDFAYAASHDLQEPLRKIHFFSDKLKNRYADLYDEEGVNMFRRMESATQRMRELIDDLLTYSQIGLKPKEEENVELDKVVQEVIMDLEAMIEEKKAHFTIDPLPVIKGDKPQLRQLFQNLISNSLKYAHKERMPFVSIHAKKVTGRESEFLLPSELLNEHFFQIDITDNGIGFSPEHSEKIFNVFQRLHGRNEYAGTGVGLAIVKKVIDNHKGFIAAKGKAGHGATFTVLLPAVA